MRLFTKMDSTFIHKLIHPARKNQTNIRLAVVIPNRHSPTSGHLHSVKVISQEAAVCHNEFTCRHSCQHVAKIPTKASTKVQMDMLTKLIV